MEGTLNAIKQTRPESLAWLRRLAFLLTALIPPAAYAQCDLAPSEWLGRLSATESAVMEIPHKIQRLSRLKHDYEKCNLTKDSVYARIIHRLGDLYRVNGDFETGIRLTREAIAINKSGMSGAQRSYLTHSYYNLGLHNTFLGLTSEAQLYYDSCIDVGISFQEKVFIALMALEKKAFLYFQRGDYQQSIAVAQRGIDLSKEYNLDEYRALLLIQQAQSETELNRLKSAEQHVSDAVTILEGLELDLYLANAYSVYAGILSRKKEFDQAIELYNESFSLNERQGKTLQSARDLNDLGLLYDRGLGDDKRSLIQYNKAIRILRTVDDPYLVAATYNNIGQVHWKKNDFQNALLYYQRGLTALPLGFNDGNVEHNPSTRQLASASNPYIAAALLWNKGHAWIGLYTQNKDEILLRHAIAAYKEGDRMVDEMRWSQEGEQSKLFWRQKTKHWYERAVEVSFMLNDPREAFHFMEKARAVLLNDRLAELGARNRLPVSVAQTERKLRMRLHTLSTLSKGDPSGAVLNDSVWQAKIDLNNFIRNLEKSYPAYYSYKYDTAVLSLHDLQQQLEPDQAWIELFSNDSTIYALTITAKDAVLKKIFFPRHADAAKQMLDLCSSKGSINRNYARYKNLSHHYYRILFQPLDVRLPRVTVSQDEYFLPFELLVKDSLDDSSFLLKDHSFAYAYSASHVVKTTSDREPATRTLLAVAPVRYDPRLEIQDLSGADGSLEVISAHFNDGEVRTSEAATKRQFMDEVADFNVVHLYSHAYGDSIGSEPSVYFYDSALNVSDLQTLPDLRTRLIVLLACNTGVGKMVKGEGIFSLARGFASAGIPSTVSALWEIDSKATYDLAESFYKHLAGGRPSDVALQQAKLDMINGNGGHYGLPYFWAGAVLIGKPESYPSISSPAESKQTMYVVLGMIALALVSAGIFFGRRLR